MNTTSLRSIRRNCLLAGAAFVLFVGFPRTGYPAPASRAPGPVPPNFPLSIRWGDPSPIPATPPSAPTALSSIGGHHVVALSWNGSPGADSYEVYRRDATGQPARLIARGVAEPRYTDNGLDFAAYDQQSAGRYRYPMRPPARGPTVRIQAMLSADLGLRNGATYYYTVRAMNGRGGSPFSNEAGATPFDLQPETIGGGTLASPAVGPGPSYGIGGAGAVLVKNWNFGANGTIRNLQDLTANFYFHDQFGTYANGFNYGALTVAPAAASALSGQPVVGPGVPEVREFFQDSLRTYLVPLNGATTVLPASHNAGCGSFMARFALPAGGSRLGQEVIWETRVRYVTPRYFWFAIWAAGDQWDGGAEMDVVESFGYDNGGGSTNFNGQFWHANSVGGSDGDSYQNWAESMGAHGVGSFDATQFHIWTWHYTKNNGYAVYVDGRLVQAGTINWTLGGGPGGAAINLHFLFDAGWGHTGIPSVNLPMPAAELAGKYFEWDYSRVYLKP